MCSESIFSPKTHLFEYIRLISGMEVCTNRLKKFRVFFTSKTNIHQYFICSPSIPLRFKMFLWCFISSIQWCNCMHMADNFINHFRTCVCYSLYVCVLCTCAQKCVGGLNFVQLQLQIDRAIDTSLKTFYLHIFNRSRKKANHNRIQVNGVQ